MAKEKGKKRKYFREKMLYKYRVVIMNEDTLQEKASMRLNRLNVFVFGSLFAIFMIVLTSIIIVYTPLRQYILGFSEAELKQQIVELTFKSDSLETKMKANDLYFSSIQKVLRGDIEPGALDKNSELNEDLTKTLSDIDVEPHEEELRLRQEVADEEKYNTFDTAISNRKKTIFFSPLSGQTSSNFAPEKKHFGVDILAEKGAAVKAIGDGTVIFAEWSAQTGFVIIIEHSDNFISVYKHNASLTKRQGDMVKAGEVIATVGNTGELTTGTHLHFELWNNGYAVDPFNYLNFK